MEPRIETTVAAIYIHGDRKSLPVDTDPTPMLSMPQVNAHKGRGLMEDKRYFRPRVEGLIRRRQVSLIDEATIQRHERVFGPIAWNLVKSQIILAGEVPLSQYLGATLSFEDGPDLLLSLEREPCYAMDLIHHGLREAMKGGLQGALALVTSDGPIKVDQRVLVRIPAPTV
ncbi:MAG: hypothetical protein ACRDFX_09980 [Chloroflexota bacterium]